MSDRRQRGRTLVSEELCAKLSCCWTSRPSVPARKTDTNRSQDRRESSELERDEMTCLQLLRWVLPKR